MCANLKYKLNRKFPSQVHNLVSKLVTFYYTLFYKNLNIGISPHYWYIAIQKIHFKFIGYNQDASEQNKEL